VRRFHFSAIRHGKMRQSMLEPDAALELPNVEAAREAADEALRDMVTDLPPGPSKVALIVRDEAGVVVDGMELEIRHLRHAKG
jgi:hypothetical protein